MSVKLRSITPAHGPGASAEAGSAGGAAAAGPARSSASRGATVPNAPTPITAATGSMLTLEQLLSRQQLRLVDAQTYLSQSLATAPLVSTSAAVESQVATAVTTLARGGAFDATGLVAALRQQAGDASLALITDAMHAHGKAVTADLEEPARTPFERALAEAVRALEGAIFAALVEKPVRVDRRRAMQSMIAASQTLDGVRAPETWMYDAVHKYTNEPGLPATLATVEHNPGAAIGVSGALLDVAAARRASLIVLTDVSEPLKDWYVCLCGVLLVVDGLAEKNGWDATRRTAEVRARLVDVSVDRTGLSPTVHKETEERWKARVESNLEELRDLGFDAETLGRLRIAHLEATWARPPEGCWLDSSAAIEHLTALAREGRIIATMTDLADPSLAGRLDALLAAHGTKLGTVHLSNALDYTPGTAPIVETLAALPKTAGACFVACTDGGYGFEFLGTFYAPKVQPLQAFLGADGIGAQIDQIRFKSGDGARLWGHLVDSLGGGPELKNSPPPSFAAFVAARETLVAQTLTEPDRLRTAQWAKIGYGRDEALVVGSPAEVEAALPPLPKNAVELERTGKDFETRFWTPKQRTALIAHMAQRFRCDLKLLTENVGGDAMRLAYPRFARHVETTARSLPDVCLTLAALELELDRAPSQHLPEHAGPNRGNA